MPYDVMNIKSGKYFELGHTLFYTAITQALSASVEESSDVAVVDSDTFESVAVAVYDQRTSMSNLQVCTSGVRILPIE